jgi:hypothetical protein
VPSRAEALLPGLTFEPRVLEAPVTLAGGSANLMAGELAVPRALPPLATTMATAPGGSPVVFSARRGAGALLISGALDAWRYRDREAFAPFWTAAIVSEAATVPPRLDVIVTPSLARPGERIRVTARVRDTELAESDGRIAVPAAAARVVSPAARIDAPIRLWPGSTPGVYEGEWRAALAADYAVDVSVGGLSAAAVLRVDGEAAARIDAGAMAIAAPASGGALFGDEASLARAIAARFPVSTRVQPGRPARSPWWAAAFTAALCFEWAVRRRRGLP